MVYDACVIGAGFGGLSTAALLKAKGYSVCVLEKAKQPGGRASMTDIENFRVDWGMHVFRFGEQGPLQKVFSRLSLPIDWIFGEHSGRVIMDGKMHLAPNGPKAFIKTDLFSGFEKLKVGRIIARMMMAKEDNWYGKTALEFVRRFTDDPRVEKAIAYSAFGLIAPDISKTSCGELIAFLREGLKAKHLLAPVAGGAGQIIDKLAEVVGTKNIHLRTSVKQLHASNGKIDKAMTSKGDFEARCFVYTAPINRLFDVIDLELFDKEFQNYVNHFEPTCAINIDFGLSDKVTEIEGGVIGIEPWLGGSFPSNADPSLAPKGKQLSTWFFPMSPADIKSKTKRDVAEKTLKENISAHFPSFFDKVIWERKIICRVLDGIHLKVGQAYPDRTPLQNPTIRNLWFAGDSAKGQGCSSSVAFNSAMDVADRLSTEFKDH